MWATTCATCRPAALPAPVGTPRRVGPGSLASSAAGGVGGAGFVDHGAVDVEAERKRLEKDLAKANKELEQTGKKLGNENFLAKAPEDVVNKIRARQDIAREEVERITSRLEGLK